MNLGQDNCRSWHSISGKGPLGQDSWDKSAWTGQPGWVSMDRAERTGLSGHDSSDKRTVDTGVRAARQDGRAGQQGQDGLDRAAGTGQLA
jgi:hypothetical protein